MAAVTIYSDFGAQKNKVWHCFHCFPIYFPWSDGTRCHDLRFLNWALSQLFHSPLTLSSRGFLAPLHFLPEGWCHLHIWGYWYFSRKSCASSSPAFLMMYSAYKLNKQGDNIQPWRTPSPIWNQSVVPCPVLTVVSWPAYRPLKRQVRWSGISISSEFSTVYCDPHSQRLWHSQ